jgi:hypothetical protein
MGHNEGFNSALGKRFGVGQEKTWHKTEAAVEADLAQALCLAIVELILTRVGCHRVFMRRCLPRLVGDGIRFRIRRG